MPDYIHLLLTPTTSLEPAAGLLKGLFAQRLARPTPSGNAPSPTCRILDKLDFLTHRAYIHANPVRARLC